MSKKPESESQRWNGLGISFRGTGFYANDAHTDKVIEASIEQLNDIAHVTGCSCESCNADPIHLDRSTSTAELGAERKYIPLRTMPSEALAVGQFLPVVELVEVKLEGKTEVQGRVGVLYKDTNGTRHIRLMKHPLPLQGFIPSTDSQFYQNNLKVFKNIIELDGPAILATLYYDNPTHFGNMHSGQTPNHLVSGIAVTNVAIDQVTARHANDQKTLHSTLLQISHLGNSGRKMMHGLHDGIDIQHHEQAGGTVTQTFTEKEQGKFVSVKDKSLQAVYVVFTDITPDLGIHNRMLQMPIDALVQKLDSQKGLKVGQIVEGALQKLESTSEPLTEKREDGVVVPTKIGNELITDIAEIPNGNQFTFDKTIRGNQ